MQLHLCSFNRLHITLDCVILQQVAYTCRGACGIERKPVHVPWLMQQLLCWVSHAVLQGRTWAVRAYSIACVPEVGVKHWQPCCALWSCACACRTVRSPQSAICHALAALRSVCGISQQRQERHESVCSMFHAFACASCTRWQRC